MQRNAAEIFQLIERVLKYELITLSGQPVTLVDLLVFSLFVIVTWGLSRLARQGAERALRSRGIADKGTLGVTQRLLHYFVMAIGLGMGLDNLGVDLAALFAADAEDSPRLYLADLAGAGAGGLLAVPALDLFGGIGAGLVAAIALSAGSVLVAGRRWVALAALAAPLGAATLLAIYLSAGWPAVDYRALATPKPITEQLSAGGELRDSRWDALARTDLVAHPGTGARYLYLDGGTGSLVPDLDRADAWARDVGAFAFEAIRPAQAFLLGSGGGLDIALARRSGTRAITAAEVNRGSVELSRELEPALYDDRVTVHIDEGRSVLRREGVFDLILLSQTVTQNAELHGIALTENALYTVEAFREYVSHLAPGGAVG
jgi:hypothetical protein